MKDKFFKSMDIPISDYPKDFIPKGAEVFIACDYATGVDYTVKGFYDLNTGEYHIQEIIHHEDGVKDV